MKNHALSIIKYTLLILQVLLIILVSRSLQATKYQMTLDQKTFNYLAYGYNSDGHDVQSINSNHLKGSWITSCINHKKGSKRFLKKI